MDGIQRDKLRGIMAEQGFTITRLAEETGVTRATLSAFLRGSSPSYRVMRSIQRALHLTGAQAGRIFFEVDLRNT